MVQAFFEQPILNSPYLAPTRHHAIDEKTGQPLNLSPIEGRRRSALISPDPAAKRKSKKAVQEDLFESQDQDRQVLTLTIINEVRGHVTAWRVLKNPADWGLTPVPAEAAEALLTYFTDGRLPEVHQVFLASEEHTIMQVGAEPWIGYEDAA